MAIEVRKEYNQGNILGTVSEAGGVPTGAIIERGSNANGEYVKYADGTLICTRTISNVDINEANSWIGYQSASIVWTYPSSFIVIPTITAGNDSQNILSSASPSATTSSGKLYYISTILDRKLYFTGRGRWY